MRHNATIPNKVIRDNEQIMETFWKLLKRPSVWIETHTFFVVERHIRTNRIRANAPTDKAIGEIPQGLLTS